MRVYLSATLGAFIGVVIGALIGWFFVLKPWIERAFWRNRG